MSLATLTALTLGAPGEPTAHGVLGHVHVTGWAIENLPPGELSDLFAEPEVRDAALFGAAFPDSGYAPDVIGQGTPEARAYAEHAHWEPFVEDYIQWMRANDPPPFVTLESRRRVAFLLGVAAHGMQDEVFDTLFLDQVAEHDGVSDPQAEADPGTDGFLAVDGLLRFTPDAYVPLDVLLPLFDGLDREITADTMKQGVDMISVVYLHPTRGPRLARTLHDEHAPRIPWTRDHYLERDIPGSLRAEVGPTMRYMEVVWERLHGRFDEADLVTGAYPESPRRLRSGAVGVTDSRASLVFGVGVQARDAEISLTGSNGTPAPFTSRGTRWGGPDGWSRMLRVDPTSPLEPGATYSLEVAPGAELVTGERTTLAHSHTFQVDCDDTTRCPPLDDLEPWIITQPSPEPSGDAGHPGDAGDPSDAGATRDAPSTTTDAGAEDQPPEASPGAGCVVAQDGEPVPPTSWAFLLTLAAALRPRRARPRCRSGSVDAPR